jgi:hypothetical protein
MVQTMQEQVFSSLSISKEQLLSEMSLLLAKQQLSEYSMEIDYLEKKYNKTFEEFDYYFRNQRASYKMEFDWMKWKFAVESRDYWQNLTK